MKYVWVGAGLFGAWLAIGIGCAVVIGGAIREAERRQLEDGGYWH